MPPDLYLPWKDEASGGAGGQAPAASVISVGSWGLADTGGRQGPAAESASPGPHLLQTLTVSECGHCRGETPSWGAQAAPEGGMCT